MGRQICSNRHHGNLMRPGPPQGTQSSAHDTFRGPQKEEKGFLGLKALIFFSLLKKGNLWVLQKPIHFCLKQTVLSIYINIVKTRVIAKTFNIENLIWWKSHKRYKAALDERHKWNIGRCLFKRKRGSWIIGMERIQLHTTPGTQAWKPDKG